MTETREPNETHLSRDVRKRLRGVTVRQLIYLSELARHQNFRKASEVLAVSQPTLSQQIKQLEDTLGVELLKRDKRLFGLTESGAVLVDVARRTLSVLGEGIEAIVDDRADHPLRIGLPAYLSYPAVTGLIARFRKANGSVPLHFVELPANELAQQIAEGKLDLAFLSVPTPVRFSKTMRRHVVWRGTYNLCLSATHPLAGKEVLSAQDLQSIDFILLPRSAHEPHYDSQFESISSICPDPRIIHTEVVHAQSQIELAATGLGACLICPGTVKLGSDVVLRPTNPPLGKSELAAFWSSGNYSSALSRFVHMLEAADAQAAMPTQ